MGREADALAFFASLAASPFQYDFYQALRRMECLHDHRPRWGQALRPGDEPVRLGQEPDLSFAPAPIASFDRRGGGRPPRLRVRLFGLLGPNGPMPTHITEYVRERLRRHPSDPTLASFLDIFHHRFLALFYRAWAQAQPHVNRDRPANDRFAAYVGAFAGIAPASLRRRDRVPDEAKLFHAGTLAHQQRSPQGLAAILGDFFRVPVRVEEFVGHWLVLEASDRSRLGSVALGGGAVLGGRVWDRQSKFRLHVGPLTLEEYERFLPAAKPPSRGSAGEAVGPQEGGVLLEQLVDWVRLYLCHALDWDVRLILRRDEVPRLRLGRAGRLGWTTWLRRTAETDAGDVCLDAETLVRTSPGARRGVAAA